MRARRGGRKTSETRVPVALLGSRGIPARYGGFETLVYDLALKLPKDRLQLFVACESSLKKLGANMKGVSFVYFPVLERFRMVFEVLYDIVFLLWASVHSVDVILLFGYTAAPFCFIPRLFGKVVIVNVDGLEWKRSKFPRPVRALLRLSELIVTRSASRILCDSESMRSYYKRRYGVECLYIPNAAGSCDGDPNLVHRFGVQPQGYYLVVARLEPENSIDMIIEGFKASGSSRRLVIVGTPTASKYVSRLLEMRDERISFIGGQYDRVLLRSLRVAAYAYIHGHQVGGTNPSLLEAMACGNPTIAYDVPFNREVARDAGVYFRDARDLAEKIKQLEKSPEAAVSMAKRAKQIAEDEYSTNRVVNAYASLLTNLGRPDARKRGRVVS